MVVIGLAVVHSVDNLLRPAIVAHTTKLNGLLVMIILYWLAEEPAHFAALRRKMPGISQKVLTQQLRELQDDGLIRRRGARVPEPVVYSLSPYGRSLIPLIESVRVWGRSHLARRLRANPRS